ncbi:hypothetical protein GJ496_010886 [Pomphorhynchus laevis]|nr:hypothetical protein GJ496_010886 [Pomphorhynchus laevis]
MQETVSYPGNVEIVDMYFMDWLAIILLVTIPVLSLIYSKYFKNKTTDTKDENSLPKNLDWLTYAVSYLVILFIQQWRNMINSIKNRRSIVIAHGRSKSAGLVESSEKPKLMRMSTPSLKKWIKRKLKSAEKANKDRWKIPRICASTPFASNKNENAVDDERVRSFLRLRTVDSSKITN